MKIYNGLMFDKNIKRLEQCIEDAIGHKNIVRMKLKLEEGTWCAHYLYRG